MTMEPHAAKGSSDQERRREIDRFYGERHSGAGLYAEVSPREERRAITVEDPDHEA